HNEGDARANLGDIGEVLLRSDADVSPAGRAEAPQFVNDSEIGGFVGREIVRGEEAAFFRQLADQSGKLRGRQSLRWLLFPRGRLSERRRRGGRKHRDN